MPVFYIHFTNGGEEQDERPQAAFAKRASLSQWFASREVHHESVKDAPPRRATSVRDPCPRSWSEATRQCAGPTRPASAAQSPHSRGALGLPEHRHAPAYRRTASGDDRPEPPYQAINARPLPLFDATATFEAVMIVLHQPSMSIPLDPLPGLYKRGGGHRGHQDPRPSAPRLREPALPRRE